MISCDIMWDGLKCLPMAMTCPVCMKWALLHHVLYRIGRCSLFVSR